MSYPFLTDAFIRALSDCGAATAQTGWRPCHVEEGERWLPLYARSDSWGEYVFDFNWAQAYQRHGLAYYPKLVTAIPFTPVEGPRWRGAWQGQALWDAVREQLARHNASGWHLLFADSTCRDELAELPLIVRQACHFRWFNQQYSDFEAFLARFQSRKRKNLRKERRRVTEQGITVERYTGQQITSAHWDCFYRCYASTYLKRGQMPYLNQAFFRALAQSLSEQTMMVLAYHQGQPVASALYLFDQKALYGRYWGCLHEFDALHFELCYYQGIEFAIEQGLVEFDPGVQGEHKILRGFEPVITRSMHHLVEPAFHRAVADFCHEEAGHVQGYRREAMTLLPFHKSA